MGASLVVYAGVSLADRRARPFDLDRPLPRSNDIAPRLHPNHLMELPAEPEPIRIDAEELYTPEVDRQVIQDQAAQRYGAAPSAACAGKSENSIPTFRPPATPRFSEFFIKA